MVNSKFRLFSLLFMGFVFALQVNAQLCGQYGVTLSVKQKDGKEIKNAIVQLLPIGKDETKGKSFIRDADKHWIHSITFSEGHQLKENYKIIVSADGYENLTKEISFPHCKRQSIDIVLAIGDGVDICVLDVASNAKLIEETEANISTQIEDEVLETLPKKIKEYKNSSVLTGTVYDANGAVIPKVQVYALNENGEKFEAFTNDNGVYVLSLLFNLYDSASTTKSYRIAKYDLVVEAVNGFSKFVAKDFKFVPSYKGKMIFDIALDTDISSCGVAGGQCTFDQIELIKENQPTISNSILNEPLEKLPKDNNNKEENNK